MAMIKSACRSIQTMSKRPFIVGGLLILSCFASNASAASDASSTDPYEHFNRKMFTFNDHLDSYVAEPISDVYRWLAPQFVQVRVFNFYNNLKNINVFINDVLQAKFRQSSEDASRFVVNSTLGLLGLFDVAKDVGLEQNDEDFEQTLAVWGVPKGPYLVLPVLGPLTVRGIPGAVFDTAANPSSYVGAPVQLLSLLNTRANAEGSLKFIDEAALDPYVFTRESFLQWRASLASDGKSQESTDFDTELNLEEGSTPLQHSSMPSNQFTQASISFSNTTKSFNEAADSFQLASKKIDLYKK